MAEKVPSSTELLEEFLRCMVCFESFRSPKVLQCQHTFCEECLKRWNGKGGGTKTGLSCPTCRARTPLPDNDIKALPSDFKVTKLGELLKQVLVKESSDNRCCDICMAGSDRKPASHFCAQCSESFCQECHQRHSSNSLFTSHHVVDLSVEDSSSKLFCKQHGSKPIKYICQECNIFICTVCAINVHNEHDVHELELGLRKYTDQLVNLHKKIEEKQQDVKSVHEQVLDLQVVLKGNNNDLEEKIDSHINTHIERTLACQYELQEMVSSKEFGEDFTLIQWAIQSIKEASVEAMTQQTNVVTTQMKEARKDISDELKSKYMTLTQDLNECVDSIAFHMASIESLSSFMEKLLHANNPLEIITVYDDLTARVNSILETTTDSYAPTCFRLIVYKAEEGDCHLGMLVEEETNISEYLARNQANSDTEESEVDNVEDIMDELSSMVDSERQAVSAQEESEVAEEASQGTSTSSSPVEPSTEEILEGAVGGETTQDIPSPSSTSSSKASTHSAPGVSAVEHKIEKDPDAKDKRKSLPVTHEVYTMAAKAMGDSKIIEEGSGDSKVSDSPSKEHIMRAPWIKAGHPRTVSVDESILNGNDKDSYADGNMRPSTTPRSISSPVDPEKPIPPSSLDIGTSKPTLIWEKTGSSKLTSVKKSSKRARSSSSSAAASANAQSPELRYPTDVCFSLNGDVIVADNMERNLQLLSADSVMWSKVKDRRQPLVTSRAVAWTQIEPVCVVIAPPLIGELASISSQDHNLVVITDSKDRCVKLIDLHSKGSCVATWGKSWFMPMFKQPSGLAITNEGKWIVTDVGRHSVSIHSPEGHCLNQFGSRGKGTMGFEHPKYVAVDHHGRILVSDSGNGGIKLYDSNGQFLFKIGATKESANLTCPMGVCVDPTGHILVADKHRHCVNLFSPDGQFIKQVLTARDNLKYPSAVSINGTGQLAVTQLDPPAVKLYQLQK